MKIAAVGEAFPPHDHPQAEITAVLADLWRHEPRAARQLDRLHRAVGVERRRLALPLEAYRDLRTFGQANDAWIETALELGERAIGDALAAAGCSPADVDVLLVSSVTGIASPSLDARLMNRMPFRPDVARLPLFGLGCVAGAAGVARAADLVRGRARGVAVVLTVELCSLTLQREDLSAANVISTGLFGDGASAAVIVGDDRATSGPEILATRSVFYPDTEDVMGWSISERGFNIVLSPAVPSFARERLPADVDDFLSDHGLRRADVAVWVCHPGGPKVLAALQDGLGLGERDLALSWRTLARYGNLSSASVLLILRDTMAERRPSPGSHGVMLAMGPGFCSELLLLRWP